MREVKASWSNAHPTPLEPPSGRRPPRGLRRRGSSLASRIPRSSRRSPLTWIQEKLSSVAPACRLAGRRPRHECSAAPDYPSYRRHRLEVGWPELGGQNPREAAQCPRGRDATGYSPRGLVASNKTIDRFRASWRSARYMIPLLARTGGERGWGLQGVRWHFDKR